ncbi:MAG: hypothetical protein JWM80_1080 [Cyanobacteria bacterium RYN_339]|nr:hypothetical protein [Cyanobacteria bacterium RYN_339]
MSIDPIQLATVRASQPFRPLATAPLMAPRTSRARGTTALGMPATGAWEGLNAAVEGFNDDNSLDIEGNGTSVHLTGAARSTIPARINTLKRQLTEIHRRISKLQVSLEMRRAGRSALASRASAAHRGATVAYLTHQPAATIKNMQDAASRLASQLKAVDAGISMDESTLANLLARADAGQTELTRLESAS